MPAAVKSSMPSPLNLNSVKPKGRSPHVSSLRLIDPLPVAPKPSFGVQLILTLRKVLTPLTLLAVIGLLPLHHWTISTQQSWGKTYRELEQLRQDERQLISLTEAQKYQVTEQIEAASVGVIPQGPSTTIFLQPQPLEPAPVPTEQPLILNEPILPPLGY
ncbi:hypothetical protein GS597_02975 [Synechococcales cyanobacterium C]|uniref:Cell division protein FtsL n=1 Tax=Petrachloros mirabilis ULC683 TaxID=2781853 RepID=A0A8K2AND4_9CYAN|nr:hypothetical protein [Petrachloros mirabilis]NCJ05493.1 hypothetical protein [Petrachloros mirabilis ULC683]